MASNLAETDAVPFKRSCMDASIPDRPAWPASANAAVSVVAVDTALNCSLKDSPLFWISSLTMR